ncbi:hypothetical protein A2U01_0004919 [Trifolium medium]|uniref:Uncharacterized protein n=1 Tax=Trifolium medium TaxID=97028 RepID=A0A392MBB5_9FABA|nr:hypothetical protein [Trifolium medium]
MTWWSIWISRNQEVWNAVHEDSASITSRARVCWEEWQLAQNVPTTGYSECMCIHDEDGQVILVRTRYPFRLSSREGETLTLLEALEYVKFETDALEVIHGLNSLKSTNNDLSEFGALIKSAKL